MEKGKTLCNLCGREFNVWDEQEDFGIHRRAGYGSKFDGDDIDLDLCCECFDKLMDKLILECKINPITQRCISKKRNWLEESGQVDGEEED